MTDRKNTKTAAIQKTLLEHIDKGELLDVGKGAEKYFGVAQTTFNLAVRNLCDNGLAKIFYIPVGHADEGRAVVLKVLAPIERTFVSTLKDKGDVVKLGAKVSAKELTAGEIRKIGAKANELKAAGAPIEERMESAQSMAKEIVANPERQEKVRKAKVMYGEGYSFAQIADALGISVTTVRKYVANEDEVITLNSLSTLTLRIRTYKREGLSNVAIGQRVGVSESTVRRRLKQPLTEEETFLELMMDELADARGGIIENLSQHPLFTTLFGDDDGRWNLIENTTKRRASFTRREGKGQRMTFTLEFSAYRQPVRKIDGER